LLVSCDFAESQYILYAANDQLLNEWMDVLKEAIEVDDTSTNPHELKVYFFLLFCLKSFILQFFFLCIVGMAKDEKSFETIFCCYVG
jgi:hypothetical protein